MSIHTVRAILAMTLLGACTMPALADYYIIRPQPLGPCAIVAQRPTDGTKIVGGDDRYYSSRAIAEKEMPTLCKSE